MEERSMKAIAVLVSVSLAVAVSGCGKGGDVRDAGGPPNVMEVTASGLEFLAPGQVPSGWVTFRFKNASDMTHFATVERLPEGFGIAEQQAQVAPVFQKGMDLINQGDMTAAMAAFGELPEWFGQIVFLGGPGLTGPGVTSQTTVYLEPGTYLLECYVKTVGIFHSYNPDPGTYGMVHEFAVVPTSDAPEPKADVTLTLSGERGIEGAGDLKAGVHTVAIRFQSQKAHENFVGHDVHLVRLEDDTDLDEVAGWMDWSTPDGLEIPAPAVFLGGCEEMPAGKTGYVTVTLEPGRYAWIAEVPKPREKGMLKVFTVGGGGS
jgi:hypothetical protein